MNIHSTTGREDRSDKGFTLVEILIAIVLVGILSAVAVVGISNLVSKGSTSACGATKDAAQAASAVYFAANGNTYPVNFTPQLVGGALVPPSGATVAALTITNGWVLTMTPGSATVAPTFVCS